MTRIFRSKLALATVGLFIAATQVSAAPPAPAPAAATGPDPYGIWVRDDGETKFDFYNCDNKLCAKIFDVPKKEDRSGLGTVIVRNAAKTKDNRWEGEIFNPQDGKTYKGKVIVEKADQLTLEGCLFGFLCKGETWTRSPDQTGASTPGGKPVGPAFKATAASH